MSAITETAPGGEMVCILDFEARPRDLDGHPIAGSRRAFSVGEHVRYIKSISVDKPEDNPLGYVAIFEPLDAGGNDFYGALQDYFVSLDCWETLKEHFASRLIEARKGHLKNVVYSTRKNIKPTYGVFSLNKRWQKPTLKRRKPAKG